MHSVWRPSFSSIVSWLGSFGIVLVGNLVGPERLNFQNFEGMIIAHSSNLLLVLFLDGGVASEG